jgi:hypothetical protein
VGVTVRDNERPDFVDGSLDDVNPRWAPAVDLTMPIPATEGVGHPKFLRDGHIDWCRSVDDRREDMRWDE